jgi:hypothetical protein
LARGGGRGPKGTEVDVFASHRALIELGLPWTAEAFKTQTKLATFFRRSQRLERGLEERRRPRRCFVSFRFVSFYFVLSCFILLGFVLWLWVRSRSWLSFIRCLRSRQLGWQRLTREEVARGVLAFAGNEADLQQVWKGVPQGQARVCRGEREATSAFAATPFRLRL